MSTPVELSRRRFLGLGAAAGGLAVTGSLLPPSLRTAMAQPVRAGGLRAVEHVIVLMQENRSFDHYFGRLQGARGYGDSHPLRRRTGADVFHQPVSSGGEVLPFSVREAAIAAGRPVSDIQYLDDLPHGFVDATAAWADGWNDNWIAAKGQATMTYHPLPRGERPGDSDDPAIWVHPRQPSRSRVITTAKEGGLRVFDLDGRLVQENLPGPFGSISYNNVDVVEDFGLDGHRLVDLAVASDRVNDTVAIWSIDGSSGRLRDITSTAVPASIFGVDDGEATAYGLTTYRSPVDGADYVFVTQAIGNHVAQLRLGVDRRRRVTAEVVRMIEVPVLDGDPTESQTEGLVADPYYGVVYRHCLVVQSLGQQPAWALGHSNPSDHDERRENRPGPEDPTPCVHGVGHLHEQQTDADPDQRADRLEADHSDEHAVPDTCRGDLGGVAGAQRIVGSDRHAEQQAEHDQRPGVPRERGRESEHDEHDQVDVEKQFAADPIGDRTADESSQHRSSYCRRRDHALLECRCVEVVGDQWEAHADDEEVETVEHQPEARHEPHPPVQWTQRRLVEQAVCRRHAGTV